jgi:hypothetical protein
VAAGRCSRGMRTRTVSAALAALVTAATAAVALVGGASPASAKGPTEATVTNPGGETVTLVSEDPGAGHDGGLMAAAEDLGLWEGIGAEGPGVAPMLDQPPGQVGPKFVVTWSLMGPDPERPVVVTQHLYPQARGGPVVYTPPGQPAFDHGTEGGWFRVRAGAPETLAGLGFATKWSEPALPTPVKAGGTAGGTAEAAEAGGAEPGAGVDGLRVAVTGTALLAAAAGAAALAVRRRRGAPATSG